MLKGIDVSEHQGVIDWSKVKASGIEFAILRAGYGKNNIDKQFKRNIEECKRVDMPIGIYWFSYALTSEMAKEEAQYAINAVKGYTLSYPIFFDFEYDSVNYCRRNGVEVSKDFATRLALAFCKEIERQGYYASNYTNMDYANNMFDMNRLKDIDIWYAYYNDNCNRKCGLWQYTENGRVPGINGNSVDMNYDFINYPNMIGNNKEEKKVKNIVIYNEGADQRAAEYLADFLNCPTISNSRLFDYSTVEHVYAVGYTKEHYTSYLKTLISGNGRYNTMQAVLDFIKKNS